MQLKEFSFKFIVLTIVNKQYVIVSQFITGKYS